MQFIMELPYFPISALKICLNNIRMNQKQIDNLNDDFIDNHYNVQLNIKNDDLFYFVISNNNAEFLMKYCDKIDITTTFICNEKLYFVFDVNNLSQKQKNIIKMMDQSTLMEKKSLKDNVLFNGKAHITSVMWKDECYVLCETSSNKLLRQQSYGLLPNFIMDEIFNRFAEIYKETEQQKICRLIKELLNYGWTDTKCAELYYLSARDKFIYDEINKSWYVINKFNIWKKNPDGNKIIASITKLLVPILTDTFPKLMSNKNIKSYEKELYTKNFSKIIKNLGSNTHKKHVLDELKGLCYEEKVFERMDNINPYLFAFNNGVYDLQNFIFRLPKPEELITCTCDYDYAEINDVIQKAINDIHKIMSSMMENEEDKDTLLTTISLRLTAVILKEGFDLLIGQGGNGKGVLRDLILYTFGSYFDPMEIEYLTKSKHGQSATAADEVMARKKNCRIVISTEPESDIEIRTNKIKQWSGGDPVQCRFNYGSCFNFVPKFRLMLQSNYSINIKNAGKSITRRINVYKFPYNFTDVPVLSNDKLEDINLKNRIKQSEYKIAFFYILLGCYKKWENNGKKIIRSPNVIEQTNIFLADNDPVTPFF